MSVPSATEGMSVSAPDVDCPPALIIPTTPDSSEGVQKPSDETPLAVTMPLTVTGSCKAGKSVLGAPLSLVNFLASLYKLFRGYVPAAVAQYGVNQGIGMNIFHMARKIYTMNVLKLDGATSARYVAAGHVPWQIKPLFGMLSDVVPFLGLRRTSYFALGGVCGVLAYMMGAMMQLEGPSIVLLLLLFNTSIAMPDVMIDAICAEQCKKSPDHASDLQSLSWGAFSVGGFLGSISSGMIVDAVGPQKAFLIGVVCPLTIVVAGVLRVLPEKRLPSCERHIDLSWLRTHTDLVALAVYMSVVSVILSAMQTFTDDMLARAMATICAGIVLVVGVYLLLRRISLLLAKTAVFIIVRESIQLSTGEAMFQWLTQAEEGPKFSATLLGWIDIFGYVGLFVGVTLYNKYCTRVSYRRIFAVAQIAYAVLSLGDLVLVKRWNLLVGIPDVAFLVGDDAITSCMNRFCVMPMFVLASKVCPDNVEATLFALLMSLNNFGGNVGSLLGVSLLEFLGVVGGNYDNFEEVIVIKAGFRLLPVFIIPFLVPALTPSDPIIAESKVICDEGSEKADVSYDDLHKVGSKSDSKSDPNEIAASKICDDA
eukprot:TRINITY_DN15807_c0_g3_i1.p1 TRINITY_DN15807_c0_g3~~TRINITY_DN15807_c0_g3_i1.p1  ORF type:complete len:610 (+),score=64.81 TRINITY_DN15807_c0_g3_i1:47-1831(+)